MVQITIKSSELAYLQDNIDKLSEKLDGDLTPLMQAVGTVLESNTTERFTTKLSPNGEYWANLLPNTVARKTNVSRDRESNLIETNNYWTNLLRNKEGILVETGDLMRSITYYANKDSVTIGTPEPYGVYHQFGAKKRNGGNMPARPFLGLSNKDESDIYDVINQYLLNG